MRRKMDSSIFRTLQMAIVIQVLTSTVLCRSQDPEPVANDVRSCTFKLTNDSIIGGGVVPPTAGGLEACQMYCEGTPDCQGVDYDTISTACQWVNTQSGLQPRTGYQHYDKICQVAKDVVSSPGNPQCIKTNYQGPVMDLWTAPNGVTWNFQIAHFGFDWPQSGVFLLPLSTLIFIDSISFKSSDNLDYFRVVITRNNGNTITTQAIGPNDKSITLSGANDVKRVDFYLASVDYGHNVSLNDINIKACTKIGSLKACNIFNRLRHLIVTASLGIIRLGGTSDTFSASVAPEYPFVELDLNCSGYGIVTIKDVSFDGAQNFQFLKISVWIGDTAVAIQQGDTFSSAQNIQFPTDVRGDRIRSTIIPFGLPDQGTNGSIEFDRYKILAG